MSRSSILHLLVVISLLDGKRTATDAWSLSLWPLEPEASTSNASCDPQSCATVDVAQLQDYVAGFNTSLPWNETGLLIETMPFGSLASDWTRLLLLQERQPTGTPMRENLLRLSRFILAAYFAQEDAALNTEFTTNYEQDAAITIPSSQTDATSINLEVLQQDDEGPGPQPQPRSFENSAGSEGEASATTSTTTDEIAGSLFTDNGTEAPSTDENPSIVSGNNSAESSGSNEAVHEKSREEWKLKENTAGSLAVDIWGKQISVTSQKNLEETTTVGLEIDVDKNLTSSEEFDGILTKSVEDFFALMTNETEKNSTELEEATTLDTVIEDFFVTAAPEETATPSKGIEDILAQSGEETVKKSRSSQETTKIDKVVDDFFVTETVDFEASATLSSSDEDFIDQMSNETEKNSTSLEETTTLKTVILDKTVEDFFANEKTINSTNSEEKITLLHRVNLTSSEEFDTQLTKSVEDFFENGSNESLKNSTKETNTVTDENSEAGKNFSSSEELGALLTESVEHFFANGCNGTNCKNPEETTGLAKENLRKNSTSSEELTKSIEDFFAQISNEATTSEVNGRAEGSTTPGSLDDEKAHEARSLKDFEKSKNSIDESSPVVDSTLDESNATTVPEMIGKTQESTTIGNDEVSESVEKSQEIRLLNKSEESKNSTSEETTTRIESNTMTTSKETVTLEKVENIYLTTPEILNNEEVDKSVDKAHEVGSLRSSTVALDESNQTSTTSDFLSSEHSNENVTENPSTTTLVELIPGSFLSEGQESETVTEAPSTTSHFEETTESAGDKVTIDDLLEGAMTDHDRPLGVLVDEVLPTPQPSIMRRVLTTFYRNVKPNELRESRSKEYDEVQAKLKVPLDALMESSGYLQEQPRVELGKILGTRTIEQRTRKRPGVLHVPDDDGQYQTFEQTTELLDEKKAAQTGG